MAEPVLEENHTTEYDAIPTLRHSFLDSFYNSSSEQALLVNSISDLRFSIDGDFELTFDSVDDLYFPSENESFFIPVDAMNRDMTGDFTPVFGGISGDCGNDIKYTNGVVYTTSGCCNQESPMDSDISGTAQSLSLSTQESADCVAHISEATTYKTSITKRKKEIEEEDTSEESRNNKYRRRSEEDDVASVDEEDEDKRNARLIRNRESAQLSRQRKKHYVEELEDKFKNLQSIITDLNSKVSYFMAENATLRHKVGSGKGMCWPYHQPPPPSGMYPVPYPWMPFPAYMVKPKGSQVVPLLPIPRLKPQQSMAKVKKSEAKTKKVASVSVLGLLFCLFLFGALAPIVNVSYGEKDMASEMKSEGTSGVGMCTEVFQFDVSSTSGAIIPASPATQQSKNTTGTLYTQGKE